MIMESLDEYLETVAGYIFDNDKVVTYKWLSKELEVHVNIAKQILWEFWRRYKEEKSFDCAFLLMGCLHDGGMRVEVVKEKDLLTVKEKFTKILSEHIYSLQKVLPEIQLLGLAENGDVKYSAIKCLENNERSDEELHMLRWGTVSKEVRSIPQENTKSILEPVKEKKDKSPEKKQVDAKKTTQKKGFDNLFGKVGNKQKSPSLSSSNAEKMEVNSSSHTKQTLSKEVTSESSKKAGQKGGLSSFLQQGQNLGKTANSVSPEAKKSTSSTIKESTSSMTKESTSSTAKESTEKKVTLEKVSKQKKIAQGKKRNRSKETNDIAKKRKRITIQSDSSDAESSDEGQEEVLEIPPSPETVSPVKARSPSPPKVKLEGGKRKVLKMVDKTFEEDGYFVTKKVHVYVSCSEDEAEVVEQPKKSVTPESRAETKGKKSTKQTTLMNFFKKS